MSRVIKIKGDVFIENRKIAIDVIQEYRCGIYFKNNRFRFEQYDEYDNISESEKNRQMEKVEQEYSRRYNIYLNENQQRLEKRKEIEKKQQEQLYILQQEEKKQQEQFRLLEQEKRAAKFEEERIASIERESLRIEMERKAIEEEKKRLEREEKQRIIEEKRERLRIEEEKRVIREEKADLIIANAKKQGYKLKKEIKEDNTIKLVIQKRIY